MGNGRFEGWYFRHQAGDDTVALIPGRSESGAFVQILSSGGARFFRVPELSLREGSIRAGNCLFSRRGCTVDLPGVSGEIRYNGMTPLRSDVMGPFRFFPMECRHGVLSMAHSLRGSLLIDGVTHCFDGGTGYAEKDSGVSFPASYQWVQCNTFPEPCAFMLSVARIPFFGMHFTGCICAVMYGGREYRLATYNGVRIRRADATRVCLSRGALYLTADITPADAGHLLRAPARGYMTETIRESANAGLHLRLWERGRLLFDLYSPHAAYEYVTPAERGHFGSIPPLL